jgi:hypothetical protein
MPTTPQQHNGPRCDTGASTTRHLHCPHASAAPLHSAMQRASALPTPAAETYTAHSTAIPAVQFNTVYLTPCTTVPSISFGTASDKRYSLSGPLSAASGLVRSHADVKKTLSR